MSVIYIEVDRGQIKESFQGMEEKLMPVLTLAATEICGSGGPICRASTLHITKYAAILTWTIALSSCSLFDSGVEWRGGPYALLWIDTPDNISLSRDLGNGSWNDRVDRTVFAVGWNGRYAVVKQHPDGDKSKTNYFIVDPERDAPDFGPEKSVSGPLTAAEYNAKVKEMNLPPFSKILASLE